MPSLAICFCLNVFPNTISKSFYCIKEAQTNSLCYKEAQTNSLCYKEAQTNSLCYNFNQKWYNILTSARCPSNCGFYHIS